MSHRDTQRERVLALLKAHEGRWVPLPDILALGIAQFGARILELRRSGHVIENRIERDDNGIVHSWYRLVPKHEQMQLIEMAKDLRKTA